MIGPLINDKQAGKVKEQIRTRLQRGRGSSSAGVSMDASCPTILTGVTPDEGLCRRDLWPGGAGDPFRTDEAIAIANDSEYGCHRV